MYVMVEKVPHIISIIGSGLYYIADIESLRDPPTAGDIFVIDDTSYSAFEDVCVATDMHIDSEPTCHIDVAIRLE